MHNQEGKRRDFLVFSKPLFGEEEINEVMLAIRSGWVGTGPKAGLFEKEFAQYLGVPYAIAVNSCTAALHLSMVCLDLKPGDEVIVPALTFCATANAVIHAGGTPVFADVDSSRLSVTAETLERALTPKTRAIVVVHFAGRSAPMDEIMTFANTRGLKVIEDCAHSIETTFDNKHTGTFGLTGCFSFYANKNVSCAEGGMFVTSDPKVAERARKLALHGLSKDAFKRFTSAGYQHYDVEEVGFKYNMPDIAAALGLHQLRRIEKNYELRTKLWKRYVDGLKGVASIELPAALPSSRERHALHLFQIRVPESLRDQILGDFAKENIGIGVHYLALPGIKLYSKYLKPGQTFENAIRFGRQTISLPLGTAMSEADVDDVVKATIRICSRNFQ